MAKKKIQPENSESVNQETGILCLDSIPDRDDRIAYLHLIKGISQTKLSEEFNLSQGTISKIVDKYRSDENSISRVNKAWKKEISNLAKRKATKIVESIEADKIPHGSRATNAAILIDKSVLLDGDPPASAPDYDGHRRALQDIILELAKRGLNAPHKAKDIIDIEPD